MGAQSYDECKASICKMQNDIDSMLSVQYEHDEDAETMDECIKNYKDAHKEKMNMRSVYKFLNVNNISECESKLVNMIADLENSKSNITCESQLKNIYALLNVTDFSKCEIAIKSLMSDVSSMIEVQKYYNEQASTMTDCVNNFKLLKSKLNESSSSSLHYKEMATQFNKLCDITETYSYESLYATVLKLCDIKKQIDFDILQCPHDVRVINSTNPIKYTIDEWIKLNKKSSWNQTTPEKIKHLIMFGGWKQYQLTEQVMQLIEYWSIIVPMKVSEKLSKLHHDIKHPL